MQASGLVSQVLDYFFQVLDYFFQVLDYFLQVPDFFNTSPGLCEAVRPLRVFRSPGGYFA